MKLKELQLDEADFNWATKDNAQRPSNFDDKDHVLLKVNIRDTFTNGHSDFSLNVDADDGGPNAIGDRLANAKKHFESGKAMDYPEVGYNLSTKQVDYTNGRHRAVAAYQMGEWFIPMFVAKDGLSKFKEVVRTLPM